MRLVIIAGLMVGCAGELDGIDSAELADTLSGVWCQRMKECDRAYYDATYDNRADCLTAEQRNWQDTHDYYLDIGCQYTDESGASLYNRFREMTCAEFYDQTYLDDYDQIWKCGG